MCYLFNKYKFLSICKKMLSLIEISCELHELTMRDTG